MITETELQELIGEYLGNLGIKNIQTRGIYETSTSVGLIIKTNEGQEFEILINKR